MAQIKFVIDRDPTHNVTITTIVQRVDPSDEIVIVTHTSNAALEFNQDSPLGHPAGERIVALPLEGTSPAPLRPTVSVDMSQQVAQCGEQDIQGVFSPWGLGTDAGGFPSNGPPKS